MKKIALIWLTLATIVITGCSSTKVTDRVPDPSVPLETAVNTVARLTMTQHPAWRPDGIGITDEFMHWGFGTATRGAASGVVWGSLAVANSSANTRAVGDRWYFADLDKIEFVDWTRKGKQWYVVSIINRHGVRHHIYRSQYEQDAMDYFDSLASILEAYRSGELKAFIARQDAAQ